jgi:hypothetical protein
MHARRRVYATGAVLTATAAIVLSGTPAQAACSAESTEQWQIGAQLGPAPIELTGTGEPLATVLYLVPVGQIAVTDAAGQNLLRLDAARVSTRSESPALPGELGLPDPVGGVRVTEAARARALETAAHRAPARPSQTSAQVDSAAAPGSTQAPVRAESASNALASPFSWVPIESFGLAGPDGAGLPWASGIAVLVLGAGVASVTVVARRGRLGA